MKYILCRAGEKQTAAKTNQMKEKIHKNNLFDRGFVDVISSPRKGVSHQRSLSGQSLGNY